MTEYHPYLPVLMFFALGIGFAAVSLLGGVLVGRRTYNRAKAEPYECGIQPTPQAHGGGKIPVKYYLTAMLFIVFDVEVLFLYPFAVAFDQVGLFSVVAMILFLVVVSVPFVYEWSRGGLEWD
ncbi:NADH-quinone oxidoreductase subunit A [Ornithinicoccus halotolerans]|uniref:NADH-quinone oxidoreductase subunit A n=1 Tax=Ornithinicoccus halotolerans TaxID=1748220 RepID=UPI0012957455|nr:NADH-quinone oxidoreductase subunit A [Ornithinicoccus halotolerans]